MCSGVRGGGSSARCYCVPVIRDARAIFKYIIMLVFAGGDQIMLLLGFFCFVFGGLRGGGGCSY